MRAEKARRRLGDFLRWAWPIIEPTTPLVWGWHLDALCAHLQAVSQRQIANLLVTIPPGCLKSTTAAVCWPAWHWIDWPSERFVTASYKEKLAVRDATRSRRVIEAPQYQAAFGHAFRLTTDQNEKTRFENDHAGVRLTASVGGATGDRGEFTLLDDPISVEDANSAAVLESTRRWHDEAFYNRVNDPKQGGRVVIGHRVGARDLAGHLKETGLWTELRLPEEFNPKKATVTSTGWTDPRTQDGELLRPQSFGPRQNAEAKKALGAFAHAAQHNQDPVPRGGVLYRDAWFGRRFRVRGEHYLIDGAAAVRATDCRHFAVCDPAGGTSQSADHSAVGVFAATPPGDLLLLLMLRAKVELQQIPKWLQGVCGRWPLLLFVAVESGFLQAKLIAEARRLAGMLPVKALPTRGKDKLARSIPALTRAEAGQIVLPRDEDAPWLGGFKLRLLAFTGQEGGEDDEADVLAYGAQLQQHWGPAAGAAPRTRGGLPG